MAARKRGRTDDEHVAWWKDKLDRMADRTFVMPEYGPRILDVLLAETAGSIEGSDLKQLGARLGVPLKFVPRAVASVTRLGIVTAKLSGSPLGLTIHRDKLARRKFAMGRSRQRLSKDARQAIRVASNNRCACCGKSLQSGSWVLDHVIPLSLLGADAEANLVPMLKTCNAAKWDRLIRGGLRYYRGETVNGRFGVRFISGEFWPVINGKVRRSKPAA
jgi:hypothetical protein